MRRSYLHLLGGVLLSLPLLFASCGNGDNALEEIINGGGSGGSTSTGTYLKWNGTTLAETAIPDGAIKMTSTTTTWSGTYIVDDDITIDANVTLGGDVDLIILDGKTLKLSNDHQISYNGASNFTLNIYGQSGSTGALVVTTTSTDFYSLAISGTINIHGGKITATASGDNNQGIFAKNMNVYGGNVTAEGTMQGIMVDENLSIYGGVVKGAGTVSSTGPGGSGIYVNATLMINKGEVTGIGGSAVSGDNFGGRGIFAEQIMFTDGTITGIGGNSCGSCNGGSGISAGKNIGENTISGGTITATGGEGDASHSGGGGVGLYSFGVLIVSGGTIKATGANGDQSGSGIWVDTAASLQYKGGVVEAYGATGANGIDGTLTNKSGDAVLIGTKTTADAAAWSDGENVADNTNANTAQYARCMILPKPAD